MTNVLNKYRQIRGKFKDCCSQKKLYYQQGNREELVESRRTTCSNLFWKRSRNVNTKILYQKTRSTNTWVNHFKQLLFIENVNEMADIFLTLFNKILETGCFPENWSNSIVCPIFKKGSISDQNNYRGISLIDILNKILTGMMYKRLYSWAEEYGKIE